MRIQRALGDLADATTDPEVLAIVHDHAERAAEACLPTLPERGANAVRARLAKVKRSIGGEAYTNQAIPLERISKNDEAR